ncbi:MAG: hypothetical protein ACR2QQ_04360 [Gammaproteobacteria bacterium]
MTELYIGLEIWAAIGFAITAIILVTPPWMDTLPKWAQIAVATIAGPILWIFISFFVIWMLRDNGPVAQYGAHQAGSDSVKNDLYGGNGRFQFGSAADGS